MESNTSNNGIFKHVSYFFDTAGDQSNKSQTDNYSNSQISKTGSSSSSARNKWFIQFIIRIPKDEFKIENEDTLTIRNIQTLDQISKCILRENYIRSDQLEKSVYRT